MSLPARSGWPWRRLTGLGEEVILFRCRRPARQHAHGGGADGLGANQYLVPAVVRVWTLLGGDEVFARSNDRRARTTAGAAHSLTARGSGLLGEPPVRAHVEAENQTMTESDTALPYTGQIRRVRGRNTADTRFLISCVQSAKLESCLDLEVSLVSADVSIPVSRFRPNGPEGEPWGSMQ